MRVVNYMHHCRNNSSLTHFNHSLSRPTTRPSTRHSLREAGAQLERSAFMIFEIAIGVALGLILFVHWREIASLGVLAAIFVLLILLLSLTCWALYTGVQAVKSMPPLFAPDSAISAAISLFFGILVNVMFAFACGQVLEQRTSLRGRAAYVFGAIFYGLFLATAISLPVGINAYLETQDKNALLQLLLLALSWIFALHQFVRLNRRLKQNVATAA